MKKKKICFICSSGGHFSELSRFTAVAQQYDVFLVTEKNKSFQSDFTTKKYFVREINRKERLFFIHFLFMFIKEFFIFIHNRPDVIITTGALCAYPMCRISKMFGKKVIYIESFARIDDLSLTGKKVYKFADLFLVQWKELLENYPKAKYYGNVFFENEVEK